MTAPTPPYTLKLTRRKDRVFGRVILHKIPPQKVNFSPTPTHFHVDTFAFTKKLCVHVPYPEGVTVDCSSEPFATYENGILVTMLPVSTSKAKGKKVLAEVSSSANVVGSSKSYLTKTSKEQADSAKLASNQTKEKKTKPNLDGEKQQKSKKRKIQQPNTPKSTVKRQKTTSAAVVKPATQKSKQDPQFSKVLTIVEEISSAEESRQKKKLDEEAKKIARIKALEDKRLSRRQQRQGRRRMLRSQMESKIDVESVKPKTKPAATICHSSTRKASKIDARTHFSNNDREATSNSKELGVPEQFRNQDSCDIPKRSILKTAIKQREGSSTRPKIKKRVSFSLPTATGDGPHQKAKAKAKNQRKIKVK